MKTLYETWQVCKILGLTQRRIINWVERGFIIPAQAGRGPGIRRKYSFDNLIQMKIIEELMYFKINLPEINWFLQVLFGKVGGGEIPWEHFYKTREKYLQKGKKLKKDQSMLRRYVIIRPSQDLKSKERTSVIIFNSKSELKKLIDDDLLYPKTTLTMINPVTKQITKSFTESPTFLLIDLIKIVFEVEERIKIFQQDGVS